MRKHVLILIAAIATPIHAADTEYIAKRLSYCIQVADQIMNETPATERARGMRWVRLMSNYMTKIEGLGLSRETMGAYMDQAKVDLEAQNANIRTSSRPMAAAYENIDKSFVECNELSTSKSTR